MIIKKERTHQMGLSNIDFRSNKDLENAKLFKPWHFQKNYGTMGNEGCHLSYQDFKHIMKPTKHINTNKEYASERPNPMYYDAVKFYSLNGVSKKIPQKTFFDTERVGELNETFKGKEIYCGDSMMIASTTKLRKKHSIHIYSEKKRKDIGKESLIKEKSDRNKEAFQETQIVKIEAYDTLEGKIDITKIKEIRLALRRRYASRTNYRKIYKEWDIVSIGEISVYTAHKMINKLGIPINYNETRALIASLNKRNTESLNMEEFMHLIFNDNTALNLDLKKLKCKIYIKINK